jgi:hypothetical protein
MHKSELLVTTMMEQEVQQLAAQLGCKQGNFPITYLGLPLSDRKLSKVDYLPLIECIGKRLPGWKAAKLSTGGRLLLINAVLAAIPVYFMSMFMLPKWVIQKIDKIRRRFLWHGHKEMLDQKRPMYLARWELVTRPKKWGALELVALQQQTKAL